MKSRWRVVVTFPLFCVFHPPLSLCAEGRSGRSSSEPPSSQGSRLYLFDAFVGQSQVAVGAKTAVCTGYLPLASGKITLDCWYLFVRFHPARSSYF